MTVYAGSGMIDTSLDSKFYREYLMKWDVSIRALNAKRFNWPELTRKNHSEYMEKILDFMKDNNVEIPKSNTNYPWIYRMNKVWSPPEDMFVVCFYNRMVIYGMPESTLMRIDEYVDGENDLKKGWFTGTKHENQKNYTGQLKL